VTVGLLLIDAKRLLPRGEFELMIRDDLPFSVATARKLRAIAAHEVLRERSIQNALPPDWTTLYELSLLPEPVLAAAVADGRVHAGMTGAEARRLRQAVAGGARLRVLPTADQTDDRVRLLCGDFRELAAEVGMVDHLVTDPPYGGEHLGLWDDLGQFAARVLRPGGFLVAYSGHYHLPAVHAALGRHLEYYWILTLLCREHAAIHPRRIHAGYKPVIVYQKPPVTRQAGWVSDVIHGRGREKPLHPWQQAVHDARELLERFTGPGESICDPMAGSGTSLVAALELGRRCLGIELEEETFEVMRDRVAIVTRNLLIAAGPHPQTEAQLRAAPAP
ncbi:MAG: DNA methyltransferase, partial [Longimicrobiales bacterium]|nr:DNA methyltransferase [Longimicrobiales bacterium]